MKRLWLSIFGCVAATMLAAEYYPGVHAADYSTSALVGVGLALVYQLLRPMIKILSFPFALVTLGLLYVLIDAGLLWVVAELIGGYTFDQFGWVFVTAISVNLLRRIFRSMAK